MARFCTCAKQQDNISKKAKATPVSDSAPASFLLKRCNQNPIGDLHIGTLRDCF